MCQGGLVDLIVLSTFGGIVRLFVCLRMGICLTII